MIYDYAAIIKAMKENGIAFREDVTEEELAKAEERFQLHFPGELKKFYLTGMPVGGRFPDWTLETSENEAKIRKMLYFPELSVRTENDDNFPDDAVPLIPLYGHRYMTVLDGCEDSPVLSVYGTDIILYGANLAQYLNYEFLGEPKEALAYAEIPAIPGWDEFL